VQTVIFDCCHSGSLTRKKDGDQSHLPRVRGVKMPVKISPELDMDIWVGKRGTSIAPGFLKSGLRSHVLLSACGADESAKEENDGGYFTKRLLATLEAAGADKVTYADLIQRIPSMPRCVLHFPRENSHSYILFNVIKAKPAM
jgi:Caspase domain